MCTADSKLAAIAEQLSSGDPEGKPLRKWRAPGERRCGPAPRVLHAVSAYGPAPAPASAPTWSITGTPTTPSGSEPEGTRDARTSTPSRNRSGPWEGGGSHAGRYWPPTALSLAPDGDNGWSPDRRLLSRRVLACRRRGEDQLRRSGVSSMRPGVLK